MESYCNVCFLENTCENCPLTLTDWANWKKDEEKKKKDKDLETELKKRKHIREDKYDLPV